MRMLALLLAVTALALPFPAAAEALPQFKTETYVGQLFWLFVSFGVLYVLVGRIAVGKIGKVQTVRTTAIETDLKEAAAAQERAKALLAGAEKALAEARGKAQASHSQLIAEATATAAKRQADQQQTLNQRLHEAEAKIFAAREVALSQAPDIAAEVTQQLLKQLMQLDMNIADIKARQQGARRKAA